MTTERDQDQIESGRRSRGPPRLAEVHDLGRHRHGLDDGRRRAPGAADRQRRGRRRTDFSFVQVSDSHLGFDKPVEPGHRPPRCRTALKQSTAMPEQAGLPDPHRRHHASVEARAVRHRRRNC